MKPAGFELVRVEPAGVPGREVHVEAEHDSTEPRKRYRRAIFFSAHKVPPGSRFEGLKLDAQERGRLEAGGARMIMAVEPRDDGGPDVRVVAWPRPHARVC